MIKIIQKLIKMTNLMEKNLILKIKAIVIEILIKNLLTTRSLLKGGKKNMKIITKINIMKIVQDIIILMMKIAPMIVTIINLKKNLLAILIIIAITEKKIYGKLRLVKRDP